MSKKEDLSFEEAIGALENIVRELENGNIKLDDAVSQYEKAVVLKKTCEDRLKAARLKIEKIEVGKDGAIAVKPMEGEAE